MIICPWHSWIARQTPTLKAEGSNPFGQARKTTKFCGILSFLIIFARGEFYAQVRDMSFGRDMRFAR